MFSFNIGGVPALKLIPLDDIDHDTFYMSSDQSAVLFKDNDGEFVVYDLDSKQIQVYRWDCAIELIENHPSCVAFYPAEVVKVSMRFEIMGGDNAN